MNKFGEISFKVRFTEFSRSQLCLHCETGPLRVLGKHTHTSKGMSLLLPFTPQFDSVTVEIKTVIPNACAAANALYVCTAF